MTENNLSVWIKTYRFNFWVNTRTHIEEANKNCKEMVEDGPVFIPRNDRSYRRPEPKKINLTQIAREYVHRFGLRREFIKAVMRQDPRCENFTDRQILLAVSDVFRKAEKRDRE